MKKKIFFCVLCAIIGVVFGVCIKLFFVDRLSSITNTSNNSRESDGELHVLTSIDDEIVGDSMWCGTFQLVWNDMINEVVKQDVIFTPQLKIAENLNKQTFTIDQLSPGGYYVKFGLFTKNLKKVIEEGIKENFNESSDILDKIDWSSAPENDDGYGNDYKEYLFYAMLKKIFNFEKEFDILDNGKFNNEYDNIKYFGIKGSSDSSLYKQVHVYYYNSDDDFAVALKTKEGEDVILARGIGGNSFMDVYNNILKSEKEYEGKHHFTEDDYLKVPKININTLVSYDELKNKYFYAADGGRCKILDSLQTIQFDLDEKGGKIKSETFIHMSYDRSIGGKIEEKHEYRYFYFDKPYIIFLKEENKDLPYFAAQISDITLFQK